MKILFLQFTHISISNNGAEQYHHNLAKALIAKGHSVISCCHQVKGEFLHDGVATVEYSKMPELYEWAEMVITTPGKLRNNPGKIPIVFIQHNQNREPWDLSENRVVYCAKHVAETVNYACKDSFVFWPFNRYAGTEKLPPNPTGKITMVNCNPNKGGHYLQYCAKKLPQYQFLGIHGGYGHQITGKADNLEYRQGGPDLRELLKDTSILIMPSEKEGMPTLALECLALGVPVIGAAIPAFVELGLRSTCKMQKDYFLQDIEHAMKNYFDTVQNCTDYLDENGI
jgi:glycosyltransferase involved in cell wall biosynthesis